MNEVFENVLEELTPPTLREYPLHWQWLYLEAHHQRHHLFSSHDLRRFQQPKLCLPRQDPQQGKLFGQQTLAILTAPSVAAMQAIIAEMSFFDRQTLYTLYLRFLTEWRLRMQRHLN